LIEEEVAGISANKNAVFGDTSALTPGGLRLGSPALTSRGLKEDDFAVIAAFLDRGIKIALEIQNKTGKMMKDFLPALEQSTSVTALRGEIEQFAKQFPMPGI
jgi:glycine hydroxymethyltransferase